MKSVRSITLERATVKSVSNTGQTYMALQDITFKLNQGDRVGIIGRNGSGKTTLARLLVGLDQPTHGRIVTNLRRMMVMQRPENHFTQDSIYQEIGRYLPNSVDLREARTLMNQLNLPRDLEQISPRRVSGGEQRLVAIACALARQPDMLILDEPMAGLDATSRRRVADALRNLAQAQTIGLCLISHHPDDLIGLVDRLCMLDSGKILYDGEFAICPTSILDICLSPKDASVYRWLRGLAEDGHIVPPDLYEGFVATDIRNLIASIK